MSITPSPVAATQAVVWGGLALGLALGAVGQASRFCIRGAIADWVESGDRARMMMWVLAVAVAATGTMALVSLGQLDASRALPWSDRFLWLSYLIGGSLFGFGMILAQGCPQRSLVKAGSGNLKAWVTLVVAAVAAQMTLRGVLALPRADLLDATGFQLGHAQDIGSMLARLGMGSPGVLRWVVLAFALAVGATALWRARAGMRLGHWAGGVLVGLLVVVAWALTGIVGFIPEHPDTLEATWMGTYSHRPEALSFAAPLAQGLDLLTLWTDRSNVVTFGVLVSLGVLLGSAGSALIRREFRIESFRSPGELGSHLVGAVMMGFGGITAVGCSVGQGVSGLSMLSTGAVLAVAGIVGGALLALRFRAKPGI